MEVFEEVMRQVRAEEAPPHRSHRSRLFPSTRCRNDEYDNILQYNFGLAKISDVTLEVKVNSGSYKRVFIDIKDTGIEMCPPTMLSNSSRIVLSIPGLCGVDDGEGRRQIGYPEVRGRA
jgi:hypothetical protein